VRVFLDANVLFSASNSGTNIERLVRLVLDRGTAVTSDFAMEEARRNIESKRPDWGQSFRSLASRIEIVPSQQFQLAVQLAEKDVPQSMRIVKPSSPATSGTSLARFM
jgi:hypothetical protein